MDVGGHARGMQQRPIGPGGHGHVVGADHVEHAQRVGRDLLQGLVSRHRGHRRQLQLRAGERQQQRHGVVVARVAVDDHPCGHGASSKRAACSSADMLCLAALLSTALIAQATPAPPTATTGAAESVSTSAAVVNATVTPGGAATAYHVEYGTSTAYGLATPDANAGAGTAPVPVKIALSRLTSETTYHYRVVATNARGTARGADRTLRTALPPRPPVVSTVVARSVTAVGATLGATVNPRGLDTRVRWEYGRSTAYGASTPSLTVGAGTAAVSATVAVGGLKPSTHYHFRAVATNAAGVVRGADRAFTTARAPTAVSLTPSTTRPVWGTGVKVTGRVSGAGSTPVAL